MTKRIFHFWLLVIFIAFFPFYANGQIMSLVRHAQKFNQILPQETVYLHLNDNAYYQKEYIWYKAYVVASDSDRLTRKSGVVYVELLDVFGNVLEKNIHKLENGMANGSFWLSDQYRSGFYEIRAYTRYMLNFEDGGVFSRVFPLFTEQQTPLEAEPNIVPRPENKVLKTLGRLDDNSEKKELVRFFPEGGRMIRGVKGRVAIEAFGRNGRRLQTDVVLMKGGKVCQKIITDRFGRGVIEVQPDNERLQVVMKDGTKDIQMELPDADTIGCTLRVDATSKKLTLSASSTPHFLGQKLGIVISHHGQVAVCDSFVVKAQDFVRSWPMEQMSEGVNSVTLFDTDGQILAERMFFKYPKTENRVLHTAVSDTTVGPNGKVVVDIEGGSPHAVVSVAVRDAAQDRQGCKSNIATYMLLESDVKGYIDTPDYYFEKDDEVHRRSLDLLMLVQGWRRYDFEMSNGLHPLHLRQPAEQKRLLMGQLHPMKKKDSVAGVDLTVALMNRNEETLVGYTTTNEKGYYTFEMPDCWDTWDMMMRTSIEDKNKQYYVGVNRNFGPSVRMLTQNDLDSVPVSESAVRLGGDFSSQTTLSGVQRLKEVVVKAKKKSKGGWQSESYGAWHADVVYDCEAAADEYADRGEACPSLIDWLKKKNALFVGNDNLSGESPNMNLSLNYRSDGPEYNGHAILWFVDNQLMFGTGMPARYVKEPTEEEQMNFDIGRFPVTLDECKRVYISTNAQDVDRVRKNPGKFSERMGNIDYMAGLVGNYTCIYVYTYREQKIKTKGLRRTYFEGYTIPTQFESPDYSVLPPIEDNRRTLYWNPDVQLDQSGKARVSFYNNSSCRQMFIGVEGIDEQGQFLHNGF